jgi:hypothetical protein
MEISQGISLCSYLYVKLGKFSCSYFYLFSSAKSEGRIGPDKSKVVEPMGQGK